MSTKQFKIHRVTALPQPLEAYSVYLVAPPSSPDFFEMYVTDATGAKAKRIFNQQDIRDLVENMVAEKLKPISEVRVVANNEELMTIDGDDPYVFVYVKDATGVEGSEVSSGGALFVKDVTSWVKVAEAESMDLAITWASMEDGPDSNPTQIDEAVQKSHEHDNMTHLNKIGEDGEGNLTYGGAPVATSWTTTNW